MTQPATILGIDPGTRVTGYGVIEKKEKLTPINFGCIRPPYKEVLQKRYWILFQGIESLIQKYNPTAVAVETQFVKKNVQSAMKLGMARGVVLLLCAKYDLPLFEYAPKRAKLAVVGNGAASKIQVQKMVRLLLHLEKIPEPEDAADALAIAICHANTLKQCTNI